MEKELPLETAENIQYIPSHIEVIQLPGGGAGNISRNERLNTPDMLRIADEAEQEIGQGLYHTKAFTLDLTRCGDGRGTELNNGGTQSFGGTAGTIKSEVLAGVIDSGESAENAIGREVKARDQAGKKSGGHRADTGGNDSKCGCGECDGAQEALVKYLDNEETLKPLVTSLWSALGTEDRYGSFDESIYENSTALARKLISKDYFANGPEQIEAVEQNTTDETVVENLVGPHKEVLWVINLIDGTKFDQQKFLEKYDPRDTPNNEGIQAFWEDQHAIEKEFASRYTGSDLKAVLQADLLRRVATAANLTAADLKIMIIS